MPSAESCAWASTAYCTSDPVPIRITSGSPSASLSTYAPLATPEVSANPSVPRGTIGSACRVRISAAGRSVLRSRVAQAAVVSLASAGRITSSPGISRRDATCSTGWWVGPSSPSPIESWVQM